MRQRQPSSNEYVRPQHTDADKDCREDELRDAEDPRADIVLWCAYYDNVEIRLAMGTAETTDPHTHWAWEGITAAFWPISTRGDTAPEFTAVLIRVEGTVHFVMFDSNDEVRCVADAFEAGDLLYVGSFAPSCIGDPERMDVMSMMLFDTGGAGNQDDLVMDIAPNAGPITVSRHVHSSGPSPAPSPSPAAGPAPAPGALRATGRIAGADRITTAVAVSRRAFPDGAAVVYLARQDLNPDALVAGALSDGPVLLVPSCGALPAAVADEIRRLGAREVFALGGPGSVCQEILDAAAVA